MKFITTIEKVFDVLQAIGCFALMFLQFFVLLTIGVYFCTVEGLKYLVWKIRYW